MKKFDWLLRLYVIGVLSFFVAGMFTDAKEGFASMLAVLALGIAWIEIRYLRVMASIHENHGHRMTEILEKLIERIQEASKP